jgi:hypothetical protein
MGLRTYADSRFVISFKLLVRYDVHVQNTFEPFLIAVDNVAWQVLHGVPDEN